MDAVTTEVLQKALDYFLQHLERVLFEIKTDDIHLLMLKEHLVILQDLIDAAISSVSSARAELWRDVWTKIGGNRKELRKYEQDLALLKDIAACHRQVFRHVMATLTTLRELKHSVEEVGTRCKKLSH